jgi:protein-disulfide isomerase
MELVARYPDHVSVLYQHLFLRGDTIAFVAADVAECATEQGMLPEATDVLFRYGSDLHLGQWEHVAATAGISRVDDFMTCTAQRRHRVTLVEQQALSRLMKVEEVPTIFVNEERYTGGLSLLHFVAEVTSILRPKSEP